MGMDPVFKRFRVKNGFQLMFASFAASLDMIIGFVFTDLIGITRLALVPVMDAVIDSDSINGINCLIS